MRKWKGIVIHHSLSENGQASDIHRWHKERGWLGIGYHFVITKHGVIQIGRSLNRDGAHARGRNHSHIGICLIGVDTFSGVQKVALGYLLRTLCNVYEIPPENVERHHELCPGRGLKIQTIAQEAFESPMVP